MASDHELFIEYGTCAVASVRRDSKRGKARASNWAARDPVRETSALWGWDLEHFVSGTAVGPIHVMDGLRVGIRTYWEARSPNSSGELRFPRGRSCSCSHRACCKAVLDERCDALARDQSSSRELGSHSGRDFLQQRASSAKLNPRCVRRSGSGYTWASESLAWADVERLVRTFGQRALIELTEERCAQPEFRSAPATPGERQTSGRRAI